MTKPYYRNIIWISAGGVVLAGLALFFHYRHKTVSNEVKEQLQVQVKGGNTGLKNEEIKEKPIKSFKETSE